MKKLYYIPLLLLFTLFGCSSSDDGSNTTQQPLAAAELNDVSYGNDAQQTMDVYLPEGRTKENTKVMILVHGGAWVAGDKEDFDDAVTVVENSFPGAAIININYRLATASSPAFPKQVDDLKSIIQFLEDSDYNISKDYAFIGASAGAHLSMLYSYKYDTAHNVKAVCDIVGPADFTDPSYTSHELYNYAALSLLGTPMPTAAQIAEVNPVAHITAQSPPTIMFYGGQDPLIPSTQGPILKQKLDAAGVYNELNFYEDGGHGDWNDAIMFEVYAKITAFLQGQL